ncbi:hypothetical protein [Janibacter melonis]|uniref:hypothetical protein n=1 Tax=Janibacter melonis TaxID=262209 RepID=UPI00177EA1B1|nr:hypothetical protein [Janibacter melonis]
MTHRPLVAALATCAALVLAAPAVASPTAPGPAAAAPAAGDDVAQVRLTGTLLTTAVEPGPGDAHEPRVRRPAHAAVQVGDTLVPVDATAVADVPSGSRVTLDVRVPDSVVDAAGEGRALRVPTVAGRVETHDLEGADVDAASDGSPAPASSDIGRATTDQAIAPDAQPLVVDEVVVNRTTAAASYTPATRKITAVNVVPRGGSADPAGSTEIRRMVAGADTFWRASSRGTLQISLERIAPSFRSAFGCDEPSKLWNDAAARIGWTEASNTTLLLVLPEDLPPSLGCSYGLGTIGTTPNSSGFVYGMGTSVDLLAHEVGHNMSLMHADLLTCETRAQDVRLSGGWWPSACSEWDYGDGQDIMSADGEGSSPMLSTPRAWQLGLLERSAVKALPADGVTRVTLRPLAGRTGLRGATVVSSYSGVRYWVEYRTPSGLDADNTYGQKTGVRVLRLGPGGTTVLLDPTPTGDVDADLRLTSGRTLRTYDGRVGVRTVSASSSAAVVDITTSSTATRFTSTSAPRISGTAGVGRTLTARPGGWLPAATSLTYRWYRDGAAISGASSRAYRQTTADAGRSLTVRVVASGPGLRATSSYSAAVGVPLHATTRPSVAGSPRVGRTLEGRVGRWTLTPTSYAYRWYRDGRPITDARGSTYRVTSSDLGRRLAVRVTARRTGSTTGIVTSAPTAAVTR